VTDAGAPRDPRGGHERHPSYDADHRHGRVIVGVDGSLDSLSALRRACDEAQRRGMPLCAVRVVAPVQTWLGVVPLDEHDLAALHQPISTAFVDALGEIPADLEIRTAVIVGVPGPALVKFARRDDDLLVVGAGEQSRWRRWSVSRYCVRHARCPVLSVPLPEFARRMRRLGLPRRHVSLDTLLDA
jgi:nucleotide-binding universal stress UspA family protein